MNMLGGGRTLSPGDMICTSSGGMSKTLALYRMQSTLVLRLVQYFKLLTILMWVKTIQVEVTLSFK